MVQVKYGVIITELKGKMGGTVFQAGNNSQIMRSKGYRKGTSSEARQNANRQMVSQAQRWRTLSDSDRANWESNKASWVFYDKFGAPYTGSGYQVFVAYNTLLLSTGQSTTDTYDGTINWETIALGTVEYSLTTGIYIGWGSFTSQSQLVQLFMSAPGSQGKSTNNAKYRLIETENSSLVVKFSDTASYESLYGVPVLGSKIAVKVVGIPLLTPVAQQTFLTSVTVTA